MQTTNIPDSETPDPANLAKLAKQTPPGLSTLAGLCDDMAVDPEAARARVSVAELAAMLANGDVPPAIVERFATDCGECP